MKRPVRVLLRLLGIGAAVAVLFGLAAVIILPSQWFREKVRLRIIEETERATGGKVEIGSFQFDWRSLRAEVSPFVLRGTEPPAERPLFRAEALAVDLKIVSMLKRDIDVQSVLLDRPQLNLLVGETGITNLPRPQRPKRASDSALAPLMKLAIQKIRLRDGELRYGDQRVKLQLYGERLNAQLAYNFAGPSYKGEVSLERLDVNAPPVLPMSAAFQSNVELFEHRLKIHVARAQTRTAQMEASGGVENFANPQISLSLNTYGSLAELGKPLRLPIEHTGNVQFRGVMLYNSAEKLRVQGRLTGQGLAVRQAGIFVRNIAVASDVKYGPGLVAMTGVRVDALDGRFDGSAELRDLNQYRVNGKVTELSVTALSRVAGVQGQTFAGLLSGPVELRGSIDSKGRDLMAAGKLNVRAGAQGVPIGGFIEAAYDRRRNSLQLGRSYATLPSSRLDFSGTLGEKLLVKVDSRDLADFTPALAAFGNESEIPLKLRQGGTAVFDGVVAGPLSNPQITGRVDLGKFQVREQEFDRLIAKVEANKSRLQAFTFGLGQQSLALEGGADIGLQNWKVVETSPLDAKLKLEGAQIANLIARTGQKLPLEGTLSATATVQGTPSSPVVVAKVDILKPKVYGEVFDRARAEIRYAGKGVEVIDGVAEAGAAKVLLSGTYEHPPNDWRNGQLRMEATTRDYRLEDIYNLRAYSEGTRGRLDVKGTGTIEVRRGEFFPQSINGNVAVRNLEVAGRALGDASINATTTGEQLAYQLAGTVRGASIKGSGTMKLAGQYETSGQASFSQVTMGTLQDLVSPTTEVGQRIPMRGSVEGTVTFSGPAKTPELITARLEIPTLQVAPTRRALPTDVRSQQFSLRNVAPIVLEYSKRSVQVKQAHLVGRDTDIQVAGTVGMDAKTSYDLRINGQLNLEVMQDFNPDVVSSGVAQVSATVRGPLQNPTVGGRMELKNAAFHVADLPNGIENATGTIVFDRQRATIQKLTAQTGGGAVDLGGFIGFAGGQILYQLQARADRVRIRYPEGVSTTASGTLTLTGTPQQSLLAGVVTVIRAGFNPRTDVGGLLASSAAPAASPVVANAFLRGMQFDVRVETVPNLQFQTSLTQDLQADAELRLRGTAAKPALLGRIVVNQGQIQFFGTKYTINRGEIGFFNPVKLEPTLDMDLETRVRGVLVNITFSGTLGKLNVSYRSDPPLQSAEIIALLAVGRAPGSNASLASGQTVANQGFLGAGGNSLLGQAVAAPVSSRLQRFFGVSRLKIDPQLTGVNAVPQARLTIEQQISRDVTLTYITNLSEANQQIIRLEWALSRAWSVVALREENGVFGIDFFFKKRLR